jgi:hypothetical protein
MMNQGQALDLAIECIRKEIHRVAVDANLHDLANATYPYAVKSSRWRKKLRAAEEKIQELKQILELERTKT